MAMQHLLFLLMILLDLSASQNHPLQHAEIYTDQNITGWVMSEKLDGIRGYWDGEALYTKKGKKLSPPKGFTSGFPPFALDGELWTKRGDFETIQSRVMQHSGDWESIGYYIFEAPDTKGDFSARMNRAAQWFASHPNPNIRIITQHVCKSPQHLNEFLDEVIAKGGEGVMVKDPTSGYVPGRSAAILKVKKAHDMEGTVVAVHLNKIGKAMKSLTLKLPNGVLFTSATGSLIGKGKTRRQKARSSHSNTTASHKKANRNSRHFCVYVKSKFFNLVMGYGSEDE